MKRVVSLWSGMALICGCLTGASSWARSPQPTSRPTAPAKAKAVPRARAAPKAKATSRPISRTPHKRTPPVGRSKREPAALPTSRALSQRQLMKLLQQAQHNDPQERIAALRRLAAYQGKAQVVLVALARSLVDSNQVVRFLAARQIIRWGPGALAYMRPALGHPDKKTRWSAAYALSQIQPKTAAIQSVLLTLLRNSSYRARGAAILGLYDGKTVSLRVWKALARQLSWDIHPINRIYCLQALIAHPGHAQPLFLKAMATDNHPLVRRKAAELLVASSLPKGPIEAALRRQLDIRREHDDVVRLAFLKLWGRLHRQRQAPSVRIVPQLRRLLQAKLWTLREAAAVLTGRLGAAGRALIPQLKQTRRDPRPEVRHAATLALRQLPAPVSRPVSR